MPTNPPEVTSLMVQTEAAEESHFQHGPATRTFGQSFWLSKVALFLFFFTFITCIIALIVLDRVVSHQNGLPLTISTSSYSWTYGPTAILIVILSLWRRVDYHFKAIQPWCELFAGPSPSSKSILLDYITPFQAVSITKALKHRHYSVTSTIAAFFLLKLVILISTTLFVMRETSLRATFPVTYQNAFNATDLWDLYSPSNRTFLHQDFHPVFSGGSAAPIWTYLGSLNNVTSNQTQWRPPDDQATQQFSLASSEANVVKLHAPVEVFIPNITCEDTVVSAPTLRDRDDLPAYREYKFVSESCNNSGVVINACEEPKYGNLPLPPGDDPGPCRPESRAYLVHRVNCSGINDTLKTMLYHQIYPENWATYIEGYDIRYAITAAQFKPTWDEDRPPALTALDLLESGCIICKIGYGIKTFEATLDVTTGSVTLASTENKMTTLRNLSSNAFAEILWNTLERPADSLVIGDEVPTLKAPTDPTSGIVPGAEAVLFQLMYKQLGKPTNLEILYERNTLKNASISVLEGVAREYARQLLLIPTLRGADVGGMKTENRLHMRRLAVWIMAGSFCLLAIICLLLLWLARPVARIPVISASIASHAAILANSPDAQAALAGTGHLSESELNKKLAGLQFSAVKDQSGCLRLRTETASERFSPPSCPQPKTKSKKHRWLPLAIRLPVIGITFSAPFVLIGIIEFLHRFLRDKDHLLVVGAKDSVVSSYIIRLVSTLVVFGLATMINNLDFTIVTFAPYSSLRSGSVSAERSILFHLLSVNPFLVVFKALQRGQFGAAASNTATLIAGFLTIIVSGLWVPMDSWVIDQPTTASVSNWDMAWLADPTDDGGVGIGLNLIRNGGAVTPATIWEDLVVPRVSLEPHGAYDAYREVSSTFDVLALQPVLNCTVLPQRAISAPSWTYPGESGRSVETVPIPGTMVMVNPPGVEPECSCAPPNNSFADFRFSNTYETKDRIWVGQYIDITNTTAGQVSNECPSIGMFFGLVNNTQTDGRNLTGLLCSQGINQVPVTINYQGDPALGKIHSLRLRGQPQAFKNKTNGSHTLGHKLQEFMGSTFLNFASNDAEYRYHPFFNQLVMRPNGHSREDLLGPNNADKLIKAVANDYCEYMRHIIDHNLRARNATSRTNLLSATDGSSTESSNAMTTGSYSAEVTHLVIDGTSKLVLQVLFATMTGFSLLGFLLVKIRGTLPRDPCNIGSTMALLVDLQLCDRELGAIPQNAEHMSEGQLSQAFDGWVFSLGWWHRDTQGGNAASAEVYDSSSSGNALSSASLKTGQSEKRFGIDIGRASS